MPAEIYVSTDVETDGPIPGPHSMLSFGSVAFDESGVELGAFERNLQALSGAAGAPETMEWWAAHPEAWEACRYRESTKRNMPRRWFPAARHSHVAVEDAREQGLLFIAMLQESRGGS